jgi:uncharacterized protein
MRWIFKATFFILFFSLVSFYLAIRPFRITSNITPEAYGLPYKDVSLTAADGVTLRGWFVPAKITTDKAIILLHGYPADKGNILPVMMFLQNQYNLFFLDFRYFGASGGHYTTIGKEEKQDLLAAVNYLKNDRHMKAIGVWGFSMGAAVALMTAAESKDIKVVVADSSFARLDWMARDHYKIPILRDVLTELMRMWAWLFFRYDLNDINPADAASQLSIPVLFINSQDDNLIPPRHGELLKQKSSANPSAKFIQHNNLTHGELPEDYPSTIANFFKAL